MKHIFHGETNKKNKPTGFHHQGSIGHGNNASMTSQGPSNSHGVYRATVAILNPSTGQYQTKDSTIFPDAWPRQKTLDEIQTAYQDALNKGNINGSKFKGTSCSGVRNRRLFRQNWRYQYCLPKNLVMEIYNYEQN